MSGAAATRTKATQTPGGARSQLIAPTRTRAAAAARIRIAKSGHRTAAGTDACVMARPRYSCKPKSLATAAIHPSVVAMDRTPKLGGDSVRAARTRSPSTAALPTISDAALYEINRAVRLELIS